MKRITSLVVASALLLAVSAPVVVRAQGSDSTGTMGSMEKTSSTTKTKTRTMTKKKAAKKHRRRHKRVMKSKTMMKSSSDSLGTK